MYGGVMRPTVDSPSVLADFYYHTDDNVDAGEPASITNVAVKRIWQNWHYAIDRCLSVVYNECIIFVEC